MMAWKEKADAILEKIKQYGEDGEGWKSSKKTDDVTVWWKPSPDWDGALYKAEATFNASPETLFTYIEPTPDGPRGKWDKAVKALEVVEKIDDEISIVRTVTHSAFGGLISSRDFIDLCVTSKTDDFIATNAQGVEHPSMPAGSDPVRGTNWPCAIICNKVPGEPNKTLVRNFIQTDLGGMLPKALVENALPSNQVDFFSALKKALADDGKLN